ncbi:MAG: alpha/beta hydrolase [Fimbriimonas sp.]
MPLAELRYFSNAIGKQTAANVYLPPGEGPWPVMFLLHGLSDDYSIWLRRTRLEVYLENVPMIVVMPDGGRGFYSDAAQGFAYATAIGEELPALIRSWFRTTDRWCVSGLSMGGYGAFRLAMDHPDTFVSACALSAALGFGSRNEYIRPEMNDEFGRITGPSPAGGPNDLYALVKKLAPANRPALRIDCGSEDFLIEDNRAYHAFLDGLGIPHEYEEHPGEHNWDYWDAQIRPAIEFHRRNLGI